MTLSVQFITIAVMVLSGIYLGLIYDTFRRLAIYWERKKFISYLLEISFWMLQACIIFYVLFRANAGEIRVYIFLAGLLGFSAYQALIKTIYLRILEKVINICRKIFRFFERLFSIFLFTPVKWLVQLCVTIVLFLLQAVIKTSLFILKIVFFPVILLGRLLYPLIPENILKFFHKFVGIYSTIKDISQKWLKYMTFRRR